MRKIDLRNFEVATSETARDINRRILLNFVRERQPVSRADLVRYSGLQPSSVSVITEELIKDRWLREGATTSLPRGRRPTLLHLNDNHLGIFGVNVQPILTDIALANLGGQFLVQESIPTPMTSSEFIYQVSHRIKNWMREYPGMSFDEIGVGIAGRVDLRAHKLVFAPNLPWITIDLQTQLETATGLKVSLENAANACALSEYWFGRHANRAHNLVVVTVAEGIGVGIILNGQLIRGTSGLAGEFGHVTLNKDGPRCNCGNYGCWEVYASNFAALRYYNSAKNLDGKKIPLNTFGELLHLAEQNDPYAMDALTQMAKYLGIGIAMLATGLAPDIITVIGDITNVWSKVLPAINSAVQANVSTHASVKIEAGKSQKSPRLQGIIALVLQKYFAAPNL